jgi:hypothetical protein
MVLTPLGRAADSGRPPPFDQDAIPRETMPTNKPQDRFGFRPSIGLMIDQQRIAMSVTAATPRGRREIAREIQPCDDQSAPEVVGRLLEPWVTPAKARRSRPGPWVRVGLPEARVFQAILPITAANRQHTAQNFFLEAVQATNVRAEDRIVEMITLDLDNRPLACVAASPRGLIETTIDMLSKLGARVGLIESAPTSLNRVGAHYCKAPRGSKLCVRFFLGETQAIGVMAMGPQALFWHSFDMPEGAENAAILAAYSTLWMMGRSARIAQPIDAVIIHGRPELNLTEQQQEAFGTRTGARLLRCSQPAYDSAAAAMGLALANPLIDDTGINLARALKPPVRIWDIFPYGEVIAHSALLGAVSLFLIGTAAEANHRLTAVNGALKSFPWLKKQDQGTLDAEKNTDKERLKAVNQFQDTRVNWSGPLRTIAAAMPESNLITALSGDAEIATGSRPGAAKSKKKLVVSFETPLAGNGSLPHEIDGFLAALRRDATLKRHFPLIEVTGFRANSAKKDVRPSASYSIVCLPGSDKTTSPAGREPRS